MTREMTVGLAQRSPIQTTDAGGWDLDAFADDVRATLAEHPGIDVLVYPELHLCGVDRLPESERTAALWTAAKRIAAETEEIQGLGRLAREHGIWLVPGSVCERGEDARGELLFNTQLVFAPTGELTATYRKIFPWRPFEPYTPGTEFVVTEIVTESPAGADSPAVTAKAVAGLSICYDAWFPEVTRHLAWMGAEIVLNVVQTTTPDRAQELVLARANAIVNQTFTVSVNCAAPLGEGQSIVVDPEGTVLAEAGREPATLVVTLDLDHVDRVRAHGTAGTNRMWSQFREGDLPIPLPLYGGRIDPETWHPRVPGPPNPA